jgi:biotin operon repressor
LLATKPYTGEKLAHSLGLGVSTISHHVGKLCKAGLVHAHPDGYYNIYSLDLSAIARMAQRLTKTEDLPKLAESIEEDAYDRKVMKTFVDSFGRFKAFPAQEKKYLVLLRHAVKSFEFGRKYTEKEVSDILIEFHEDYSKLRRDLIEYKFMAREGGGKSYWRIE